MKTTIEYATTISKVKKFLSFNLFEFLKHKKAMNKLVWNVLVCIYLKKIKLHNGVKWKDPPCRGLRLFYKSLNGERQDIGQEFHELDS